MKIALVGGTNSIHFQRWIKGVIDSGHTVLVITDQETKIVPHVEIVRLRPVLRKDVGSLIYNIIALRTALRQFRPDLVHAHYFLPYGLLVAFSGYHPSVLTIWGSDLFLWSFRSAVHRTLARSLMRRFDLITSRTEHVVSIIRSFIGCRDVVNLMGPWGVDTTVFRPISEKGKLREELGIRGDPVLLSPRALRPNYNISVLVAAFRCFAQTHNKALLLQADYGEEGYRAQILNLVYKLGLTEQFQVFRVPTDNPELMAKYYNAADLVISVPISDVLSQSILEAICCGTPVLVSDIPSIREWVSQGETGFVAKTCDDPIELARTIEAALIGSLHLCPSSFSRVAKQLDIRHGIQEMNQVYETLWRMSQRAWNLR